MAAPNWPPTLEQLKGDIKQQGLGTPQDDDVLQSILDAAVEFVQDRKRKFRYDETDPDQMDLPPPSADLWLGTIRLAARWNARRRSQDAMINMQELGVTRVSSGDSDIDRMLRLGRYAPMEFA